MDAEQGKSYPVDFLMSLELSEVPFHGLRLKVQVLVSLMRNIDALRLCKGVTESQITHLGRNIEEAMIMTRIPK